MQVWYYHLAALRYLNRRTAPHLSLICTGSPNRAQTWGSTRRFASFVGLRRLLRARKS